ncbi:MAG TPA: hypothetical protein VMY41_20075 [Thermohalobaculum sp.]|nr:hypothetical protein [Thermohalobaculum sp.]
MTALLWPTACLAETVDHVDPYGCIMAGDWLQPFREARRAAKAEN